MGDLAARGESGGIEGGCAHFRGPLCLRAEISFTRRRESRRFPRERGLTVVVAHPSSIGAEPGRRDRTCSPRWTLRRLERLPARALPSCHGRGHLTSRRCAPWLGRGAGRVSGPRARGRVGRSGVGERLTAGARTHFEPVGHKDECPFVRPIFLDRRPVGNLARSGAAMATARTGGGWDGARLN